MAEIKDAKPPKIRPRPVEWVPPAPVLTHNEAAAANGGRSYTGGTVRRAMPKTDWLRR